MATLEIIRRADENLKDKMQAIADEFNQAYQKEDNETYSIERTKYMGNLNSYVMYVKYHDDNDEADISLYRCSKCGDVLTEGESEEPQCTSCWEEWE